MLITSFAKLTLFLILIVHSKRRLLPRSVARVLTLCSGTERQCFCFLLLGSLVVGMDTLRLWGSSDHTFQTNSPTLNCGMVKIPKT